MEAWHVTLSTPFICPLASDFALEGASKHGFEICVRMDCPCYLITYTADNSPSDPNPNPTPNPIRSGSFCQPRVIQ